MQGMLSKRKPINSVSEAGFGRQMEAIIFGVKGSLRKSGVSMYFKEGVTEGEDQNHVCVI